MRPERLKVVSVLDPAVDTEAMSIEEVRDYIATRDIKKVRLVAGKAPTIFNIREVPNALFESFVMAASNEADRLARCFRAGVVSVENLYARDDVSMESLKFEGDGPMPEATAFERFSPAERQEIGQVIWTHSFLAPRIAATYQLPPTCLEPLANRAFRPAEPNQSEQASNSGGPSSASEETQSTHVEIGSGPSASVASSDSHTDATVTTTA